MYEEWREITMFPGYSVSKSGAVRNDDTGQHLTLMRNQRGTVYVGLTRNRKHYNRSVPIVVLEAFSIKPSHDFNSPIHLDGDRWNNKLSNLMWRPRWFSVKYHQQFQQSKACFEREVQNIETKKIFSSSWEAATTLGILDREIAMSVMSQTYVWPIYQHFRLVE